MTVAGPLDGIFGLAAELAKDPAIMQAAASLASMPEMQSMAETLGKSMASGRQTERPKTNWQKSNYIHAIIYQRG